MCSLFLVFVTALIAYQCRVLNACLEEQIDFQENCEKQYGPNAFANGARCFFVPEQTAATWDGAWQTCKNKGGTLAPVLTSSEMAGLNTTLKNKIHDVWLWTSAKRSVSSLADSATGSYCSYARNTTYFLNSEANDAKKLPVQNTWLRNRKCDDIGDANHQCIHLWASLTLFGDWGCTLTMKALCVVESPVQEFRRVADVCVTETPIVSYAVASPDACADACRNTFWCRSFNFIDGNGCQLFPWWIKDSPNVSYRTANCIHFTYIP